MTEGYMKTCVGEIQISYVKSFKTLEAFLKAHPELSEDIYYACVPKKVKKPEINEAHDDKA